MNSNGAIEKPTKVVFIINIILVGINIILSFGTIALHFSRGIYAEISEQIFSMDKPLMDSAILDLLLRKELSIIIFAVLVWTVMKERKKNPIKRRMLQNAYALIGLTAYNTLLLYLIYKPILQAG